MDTEATVYAVGASEDDGVPVVVLEVGDRVVPVLVSRDQAHAISLAVRGEQFERPLTHDLLVDLVTEFGGAIDSVRIDDLVDNTFYAKLDAERYHGGERQRAVFDVRASDAIAIAVRAECPIHVDSDVVQAAGRSPDELGVADTFDEE